VRDLLDSAYRGYASVMPSQSTLLGAPGEHYVLCQLLRRGYIAALASIGVLRSQESVVKALISMLELFKEACSIPPTVRVPLKSF
jgi:hypothetical protein